MIELLKERFEEKSLKEREERRNYIRAHANDDDEEFDEAALDSAKGIFVSAEERKALLRQFQEENDEEEEVDGDDVEMEVEEEEVEVLPDAVAEELEANAELAVQDEEDDEASEPHDEPEDEEAADEEEEEEAEEPQDNGEEDEVVPRMQRRVNRSHGPTQDGNDDGAALQDDEDDVAVKAKSLKPLKQYGKSKKVIETETNDAEEVDDADAVTQAVSGSMEPAEADEEEEEAAEGEAVDEKDTEENIESVDNKTLSKKLSKSKVKTGNALFRMQLEQEERRARKKVSLSFSL